MSSKRLTKFITGAVAVCTISATGVTALAAQRNISFGTAFNRARNIVGEIKPGESKAPCKIGKGKYLTGILEELVKDGTLTQNEMDRIVTYQKEKQESMRTEIEKLKNMTEEERKNYFNSKKEERQSFLSELVDKGIITQAKADVIKAKMEQKHQEMKAAKINEIKSQLGTLVKKGTINQAQADKVVEYMSQRMDKVRIEKSSKIQADKEKIMKMTEEERKSYFEKIRGEKGSFLKELVDNGTLTQDQANAVRDIIRPQHGKGAKK